MRFYGERVLPQIINVACNTEPARSLRSRVCANLSGEVIEIGFGSGLNVPYYPQAVTRVTAVDPSENAWLLAGRRVAATSIPVRRSGLDGQSLPFPDNSFDAALSTWTMCTIPDVATALAELRRVLKPGGRLHFLEHGLAPDESVRRWQRRIEPVNKRIFGGCHLTKPIAELIAAAGFTVTDLDVFYEKGAPKFVGAQSRGIAMSPPAPDTVVRLDDFSTLDAQHGLDARGGRLPDSAER
ncbi:MAG: class I SAM-dependent methyltransferase [Frankiaceae bacterium]